MCGCAFLCVRGRDRGSWAGGRAVRYEEEAWGRGGSPSGFVPTWDVAPSWCLSRAPPAQCPSVMANTAWHMVLLHCPSRLPETEHSALPSFPFWGPWCQCHSLCYAPLRLLPGTDPGAILFSHSLCPVSRAGMNSHRHVPPLSTLLSTLSSSVEPVGMEMRLPPNPIQPVTHLRPCAPCPRHALLLTAQGVQMGGCLGSSAQLQFRYCPVTLPAAG